MAWQVKAVTDALDGADPMPPVIPVLCFINADWPVFGAPDEFHGVRLVSHRSLKKLVTTGFVLDEAKMSELASVLGAALPTK